jgi:spore maturation protein CgeB
LAKTVNDLLDDSSARVSMASKGRELVLSKYTYEQNANDFIEIYQSIVS